MEEQKKDLSKLESGEQIAEAPPSYQKAVCDGPPSYSSLYADLKRSQEQCNGKEFAKNAFKLCCGVVCGSVLGLIFLAVMTAIPISMIVMGSIHLDDCPAERFIPIYLVVGGAFGLFESLCSMCKRRKKSGSDRCGSDECGSDECCKAEEEEKPGCLSGVTGLVSCFLFAWFIAGNVWVYRTYNAWSSDETAPNYCHPTLYLYSFWLITACYIMAGACIVVLVVVACCACVLGKSRNCSMENCGMPKKIEPTKDSSALIFP